MMDKMVSYKRYATNLVIANIIIATVWILLSVSLVKTLDESNKVFVITSMAVIGALNILSAYFGITAIIRHSACELTAYYILAKLAVLCETFLYLLIIFTDNRYSAENPITSTVHTGVTIVLIITQIWLIYETRNFNNLSHLLDDKDMDDFRVRGLSAPPNICDIENPKGLYSLTDQLMVNPMVACSSKSGLNSFGQYHDYLGHNSQYGVQPPVYESLSQPIRDDRPQNFYNRWTYPSQTGFTSNKW